ncbi:MAG TPA: hypothetical protein VIZ30_06595 [Pseudomonadales bacterium]
MPRRFVQLSIPLIAIVLLGAGAFAAEPDASTWPNPYLATVAGPPAQLKAEVPATIPLKVRRLPQYAGREIPDALHYGARLEYSYAKQKGPAPLVFVIAGTGAAHDSALMQFLMRVLYAAGLHVVGITSPTHPAFIISASSTQVPGEQRHDAQDLYDAMQRIRAEIAPQMQVTAFYLTGYSIGGTNAAFVAMLDEERHAFDFEKVLLLDPCVDLYTTISKLDRFLENIPGGIDNLDKTLQKIADRIGATTSSTTALMFSPDLAFAALRRDPPSNEELIALIGMSFRLAASSLIFTSDVMTDYGFIKPANVILTPNTNLDDYVQVALRVGLTDYFHEFMWPYFVKAEATEASTRTEFADLQSLKSIRPYLASAQKIAVVGNRDDVLLGPGDIDFLVETFGARAKIFVRGGHLGRLEERDVVAYIADYFKR